MVRHVSSFLLRKIDQNSYQLGPITVRKILLIKKYEKIDHFFISDYSPDEKVFKQKQFYLGTLIVYTLENILEQFGGILLIG